MEFNTLNFSKNNSQGCVLLILPNTSRVHGHHQFDHLLLPMPINGNFSLLFFFFVVCILLFRSNHIQIWKKKKWDEWGRVFKWVHYKRWCEQTQRTTSNQMKCIPSLEALPTRNTRDQWTILGENPFQCISLRQNQSEGEINKGILFHPNDKRKNERSMSIIRSLLMGV